jgi:glutaredoxin
VPAPVLLYTIAGCAYCDAMRASLAARGVVVEEIDVGVKRQYVPELLKLTKGKRVVPVVVDDGKVIVAPDDVRIGMRVSAVFEPLADAGFLVTFGPET